METDILGTRLAILNNSIRSLGTAKEAEERNTMIITQLNQDIEAKNEESHRYEIKIADLLSQHDKSERDLNDMNVARIKANQDRDNFLKISKDKINYMEKVLKKVEEENKEQKEEIDGLKKTLKVEVEEKNLLRDRINDMKTKRNINI